MSISRIARNALAGGTVVVMTGLLGACGADSSSTTDSASGNDAQGEADVVRIAYTPVASAAPLALGVDQGIFEEHGIDLQLVDSGDNSAAIAASVASGEAEAGLWTWASLAATAAAGVPVTAISPMDEGPEEGGADFAQIVALESSGVTSIADLVGQQLAVNSVGGLQEFIARSSLDKAGVAQDDVELVPIPIVNMASALRDGQVPAVSITEPFLSQLKAEGDVVVLADSNLNVMPGLPYTCVIMSDRTIADDPDLVQRFQTALQEAMAYAREHEDEVRAVIPDYTGIDAQLVAEMTLPNWSGEMDLDKAQEVADRFHEMGLLEDEVDISTVILPLP